MRKSFEFPATGKAEKEISPESMLKADVAVVCGGELRRNKKGKVVAGIESKMRALGALELLRRGLAKKIILTGGVAKEFPEGPTIAEAMKDYLVKKGVPEDMLSTENVSKNTAENIGNTLVTLDKEVESVLLETNEFHLPRARQLLENTLREKGLDIKEMTISAEELLNERSPHYQRLTSYYQFPESLKKMPRKAAAKGLREFLRRVIIRVDKNDKIATLLSQKLR